MVDVRFRPAVQVDAWRAAVSGSTVAVLPPSTTAQTAEAVWRRLATGGIAALIEGLTGAFGTSLTAIPPFALATVEDEGVRVAVRGPIELLVESTDGTEAVSGAGVATWVERLIPGTYRVTLTVDEAVDAAEALPLLDGVVPIAGVVLVAGPVPALPPTAKASPTAAGGVDAAVTPPLTRDAPADAGAAAGAGAGDAVTLPVGDASDADAGADASSADSGEGAAHETASEGGDAAAADAAEDAAAADGTEGGADAPGATPFVGSRWSADDDDDEADGAVIDHGPDDAVVDHVPGGARDDATEASAAEPATAQTPGSEAAADTWLPAATAAPADDDIVFGATVARPSAAASAASTPGATPAASTPVPPMPPLPPVPPLPDLGDHDGATIAVSEMRKLRDAEREKFESTDNVPPRHPSQGRIRLSTGRVVELERPVVIGRRPRSTRASGDELPTLIAVDSPQQDISRSHVEIRAEGEHVLVTDLDTTNGTVLLRAGNDPVRLHPGEPTLVVTADILDLGDGVTLTFEDLP